MLRCGFLPQVNQRFTSTLFPSPPHHHSLSHIVRLLELLLNHHHPTSAWAVSAALPSPNKESTSPSHSPLALQGAARGPVTARTDSGSAAHHRVPGGEGQAGTCGVGASKRIAALQSEGPVRMSSSGSMGARGGKERVIMADEVGACTFSLGRERCPRVIA